MKNNFFRILIGGLVSFCLVGVANAGTEHNVQGWAWSNMNDPLTTADESSIGWISFNSLNCDIDGDGVYEGAGEIGGPAPEGCPTSGVVNSYGVNINPSTGIFSGYAWSENVGWISFNSGELVGCPSGSCQAIMDVNSGNVSGWARACAVFQGGCSGILKSAGELGGWDGWIKLAADDRSWGVSVNRIGGDPNFGKFSGYAWGDINIGWVNFSSTFGAVNVPGLPVPDNPPDVDFPVNYFEENYCSGFNGIATITFDWNFVDFGDSQSKYQIKINSMELPENVKIATVDTTPSGYEIAFNTTYDVYVKVWDQAGQDSGWKEFPSQLETDSHAWPYVVFEYSPESPTLGQPVHFDDKSICYQTGDSNEYSCAIATSYSWNFGDGSSIDNTKGDTSHIYTTKGTYEVSLAIVDDVGTCSTSTGSALNGGDPVNIKPPIPKYQEIPPIFFLRRMLVQIGNIFSKFANSLIVRK